MPAIGTLPVKDQDLLEIYSGPSEMSAETISSPMPENGRPNAEPIAAIRSTTSAALIQKLLETIAASLTDVIKTVLSRDKNVRKIYVAIGTAEIRVTAVLDDISPKRREAIYSAEGTIIDAFPDHVFHFITTAASGDQPDRDPRYLVFQR
jgi:hypothetical protein